MSKPNLIILTNSFPGVPSTQEIWLLEELTQTHQNYNNIIIVPFSKSTTYLELPGNCSRLDVDPARFSSFSAGDLLKVAGIVSTELPQLMGTGVLLKESRYNLSLIKNLYLTAKLILDECKDLTSQKTLVYAYWADNLATCAAIMQSMNPNVTHVTRAHSYEIYEEQTKYGYIPFRSYQLKHVDKIYKDSKKGYEHLLAKHPKHATRLECSYVGVNDHGTNPLPEDKSKLHIVTCSFAREQKRLYLLPEILQHIQLPVTWHLIGEGPDIPKVRQLCEKLPSNIEIKFIGYLSNEAIIDYYKTIPLNLFVSVSSIEGLPVSLIEAISFGLPILSTDVGGCNEICNEQTGILIQKTFDPKDVAKQIRDFNTSPMNTDGFRKGVRLFWKEHFDSAKNYHNFSKKIIALTNT
ncbi:MAG: glycosyltransferase [Bacteroidia bacterium]